MRQKIRVRWIAALLVLVAGCPAPRRYALVQPGLSCARATRVAYGTMQQIGYKVTEVVEATPSRTGRIVGTRQGPDGGSKRGTIRITCDARQAMLQPVESDLVPTFEFSRAFNYSFRALVAQPDDQEPTEKGALQVSIEAFDGPRATLDLGGWPLAADQVLVRVIVRNGTDRPVVVEGDRILLVTPQGDLVSGLSGGALAGALDTSESAGTVRASLLERERVGARTTLARYLVFPPGAYEEAQVSIEDVETGESDGFQVPVQ